MKIFKSETSVVKFKKWIMEEEHFIPITIFIYYLLYFSIILKSGYYGDDALNSNARGVVYNNNSILNLTFTIMKSWFDGGRVFPFAFYVYELFSLVSSRIIYKLLILITIFINNVLFGKYVKSVTGSDKLKYTVMLLFPIFIQLNSDFANPIYSYHMLMQITLMWLFLSLNSIISYIKKGKKFRTIFSTLFFLIALCTYEIAFTFIVILFLTVYAYTHNIKKTIKILTPHLLVLVIMFLINIYFRSTAPQIGFGSVTINWDFYKILITYLKQCFSAFPLARYFTTFGKAEYPYTLKEIISGIQLLDLELVIFFFFIIKQIKKSEKSEVNILNKGIVILIAFLFYIMPGVLIGMSSKYQAELSWGTGHLPSYMQSFGFTLICAILIISMGQIPFKKYNIILKFFGSVIVIFLIIINQQVGRISVENSNAYLRWPRENVENAIRVGILEDIASGNVLIGTTNYTFDAQDSTNFYSLEAKKQILGKSKAEIINELVLKNVDNNIYNMTEDRRRFAIHSEADKNSGYVIIGECMDIELNYEKTDVKCISVINPKIYIQGDFKDKNIISLMVADSAKPYQYKRKTFLLSEMEVLNEEKTNRLYQLKFDGKIDINSLVLTSEDITYVPIATASQIYYELGKGFSGIEGVAPFQWTWLSNDSELIVYNYLNEDISYHMIYNIYSGYEETSYLEIYVNDKLSSKYSVNSKGTTIDNDIELNLGQNIIKFKTDAKRVDAPGDPRELYLRVTDFNFNDVITKIP